MDLLSSGKVLVESFDFGLCGVDGGNAARDNFFAKATEVFLDECRSSFDSIILFFFIAVGFVGGKSFFKGVAKLWEESGFWCWWFGTCW